MSTLSRILKNQQGIGVVIVFLILVPLLFFMMVSSITNANLLQSSDMDIQEALVMAVKGAAEQVDVTSQAEGNPLIDPQKAHEVFRGILMENLGLDNNLEPITKKYLAKSIKYSTLIYNGNKNYTLFNVNNSNVNGTLNIEEKNYDGTNIELKNDIYISGINIKDTSDPGSIHIKVKEPTIIAVMQIDCKDILRGENITITRWAAAKVHKTNN